ncbi:Nitrite reductase [NAD(P)H] small subunit [Thioalkalivibrio nitratireducens DSM 14787]|uniref:Nitrite reductase [NAD(P)H] small subunit n=1 Tax=Thioalkalivibrio nitratireducens (strain DSM 14787 / UNIQEM 213 / ALEN2) TaxID=1255043 RepID=L0DYH7_THIND|nr:nitrite reductase small subunit NirD [Thioalkalivibrio nitratireducens]AGA34062.1 Nitrite reductase [NAD(P)H] small subunit [Thioalkalivibrio nitratireducens DSM 14787]
MNWVKLGALETIPRLGARVVAGPNGDIAVFRTAADGVFALADRCPHKGGPLSQGIVHGERVTCPLHNWVIDLASGSATGPDTGCTGAYRVRVDQGQVWLDLDPVVSAPVHAAAADPEEAAEAGTQAPTPAQREAV